MVPRISGGRSCIEVRGSSSCPMRDNLLVVITSFDLIAKMAVESESKAEGGETLMEVEISIMHQR